MYKRQLFEQLRPLVERLVEAQKVLATKYLSEAKRLIASNDKKEVEEGFLALYRSHKCLPKNKALIKFLSEQGIKAGMLKTEEIYMEQNNKRMHEVTEPLYFVIEEKLNSVDLTDKGIDLITGNSEDPTLFVLPDICLLYTSSVIASPTVFFLPPQEENERSITIAPKAIVMLMLLCNKRLLRFRNINFI